LLQTEAYARAVAVASWEPESATLLDEFVAVRMNRKNVLTRATSIRLKVIVSEAVLRHPVGGPEVFGEQLRYLRARAATGEVFLQILPFGAQPHPGMAGAFTVLRLPSLDVAHIELMNSDAYIEDEVSVDQYMGAFKGLSALALSSTKSDQLIAGMADML
jgi:hypothetical protein